MSILERNPAIEVITSEISGPTPPDDLTVAIERANGRLPVGVEDFYREVGSFRLEWRHSIPEIRRGDRSDGGFINILPIRQVFAEWQGVTWFPNQDDEFRLVKPFDMFTPEACTAFLQPADSRPADSVAYHYFGEELCDTGYTFDEYLERLLASRGYWYWPQTLCPGSETREEVLRFRHDMPVLFADYDDALFQPRPPAR